MKKSLMRLSMLLALLMLSVGLLSACGTSGDEGTEETREEETAEVWTPAHPEEKTLDLSGGDLSLLDELVEYPKLETLDLTGMDLSKATESDIQKLLSSKRLEFLDLHDTKVSVENFDILKAGLPGCKIAWQVPIGGKRYEYDRTHLVFDDLQMKDHAMLSYFDNLQSVDMLGMNSSLASMQDLAEMYPDIRFDFSFTLKEMGLKDIHCDSQMTMLDLNNIEVTDLDTLREYLVFLPRLEQLEMCDSGPSNEEMAALREDFPDIKVVWMIHMSYHAVRTDVVAYSTLSSAFESRKVQTEEAQQLKYCTDLLALDIGHQNVTDLSFLSELPNIRVLIIADNNVTDLSPIANCKHLRYLEMFMNYNAETLEPLRDLTELEYINMCFVYALPFDVFLGMPNLKKLWITGCDWTWEEYLGLCAAFPTCRISAARSSNSSTDDGWRVGDDYWAIYHMFRGNYLDPLFMD